MISVIYYVPDKKHEARRTPERDDEGTEDRQSQEVRKHSVTTVSE